MHGGPWQLVCLFHVNSLFAFHHHHHNHHQLSLIGKGRWGTTDDFTTSFAFTFAKLSSVIRAAAKEWCASKCTLATANIDSAVRGDYHSCNFSHCDGNRKTMVVGYVLFFLFFLILYLRYYVCCWFIIEII